MTRPGEYPHLCREIVVRLAAQASKRRRRRFFQFALVHRYRNGVHKPGRTDIWSAYMAQRDELLKSDLTPAVNGGGLTASRGCIGTPEQVRNHLRIMADMAVDQIVFIQQGGKNKHEDICASLELFAAKVMPEFQEEEQERQRRKQEELAPFIKAAFERKRYMHPLADEDIPSYPAYGFSIAETAQPAAAR